MAEYSGTPSSWPTLDGIGASEIGVIAGAAVFLCLSCYHGSICTVKKSWCSWGLPVASLLECLNLLDFAYSLERPRHKALHIFGAIFRWSGPFLMFLSLVQLFGRLAWYSVVGDARKIADYWGFLRWNTVLFFILHSIAFAVELVGSIMAAAAVATNPTINPTNDPETLSGGRIVVGVGLVIQLLVIIAFCVIVARFRAISTDWDVGFRGVHQRGRRNWRALLTAVLVCCLLAIVLQAVKITLCFTRTPQWLLYVCNSVTLLVVFVTMGVIHPYRCLPPSMTCFRLDKSLLDIRHPPGADETKVPESLSSSEESRSSEEGAC